MPVRIIDVHSHPLIPEYRDAMANDPSFAIAPAWSVEQHLAMMDEHDIGIAVLSLPSLADVLVGVDGAKTARGLNEALAQVVSDNKPRFGAFAVVPMDDMELALEEAAYALDELHLDGICVSPNCRGVYLGDPVYDPLLEELDGRRSVLFVHPGTPPYWNAEKEPLNVSTLEFMFETTRMVTSLILSGRKNRYPDVKIIATHGGGTIPYLAHRVALASHMPWAYAGGVQVDPSKVDELVGSFYYDITASTSDAQLDAIRRVVPVEHLMMGFDYPMMPPVMVAPAVADLDGYEGWDAAAKSKIRRENAWGILPGLSAD